MENKLGMFIHWGIYALEGVHEQVLARNDIPNAEYEKLALRFDPQNYDPDAIVSLAKETGMEYICVTAKHHDGFCMWDTKQTGYSIMHTPYGKDVLKMLADACAKQGMRLSIYYSNPDWHHPNAYNPLSTHQWKSVTPEQADSTRYREFIKAQITELLTGYGPIYTLFWDIPPMYEDRSINDLVRHLQPGILINNRGYDEGDFATPERFVPEGKRFDTMTEACQSVGVSSWGWRKDEDYFSTRHLMRSVDKIMAMDGSYLLNIGPKPDGSIDPEHIRILKRLGLWYNSVRGSLQDMEADPYEYRFERQNRPFIAVKKGPATYFHFYEGLDSNVLIFGSCPGVPRSARLLNTGASLEIRREKRPEFIADDGTANGPFVILRGIDTESPRMLSEPPVIEVLW